MLTAREFLNNQVVNENATNSKVSEQGVVRSNDRHSSSVTSDEFLSVYQKFYQDAVNQEKKKKADKVNRNLPKRIAS